MIPDDMIDKYIGGMLNNSSAGDSMHQLLISSATPGGYNAFGLPDQDKLKATMYGIIPTAEVEPEGFVAQTVRTAIAEQREAGLTPIFAALTIEAYSIVTRPTDEVAENLARRLVADDKLDEHPDAVEVTMLYAACRDGRRWAAQHILTGPRVGETIGPTNRIGPLEHAERRPVRWLVRSVVGLGAMR